MSRNGSGTYAVPNTFVAGTTITAADHNENWSDIGTEITNSVAVDGQSSMTGPLKASSGSVGSPSFTFAADADTGAYRSASNEYSVAAGGARITRVSSAGLDITSGTLQLAGANAFPLTTANITDANVTYAKIQDVSATKRALGRNTSGSGDVEEVTAEQIFDWIGTAAQGDIFYRNATTTVRLAAGTAGKALTTNGAGQDPTWENHGWVLLNTLTASNSTSLADTTSFTATHNEYMLVMNNLLPASNLVDARLRVNSGGVQTSSYISTCVMWRSGSSTTNSLNPTTFLGMGVSGEVRNTGVGVGGRVSVINPSGSSLKKQFSGTVWESSSTFTGTGTMSGWWDGSAAALTGFEFSFSSGNITSGTIKVYGRL